MKYFTVLNILFIISKVILEMWSRFNDKAPHTPPPPLFLFNLHKMFFLSNKSKCYKYYLMLSCITKTNYLPIPIQSKTHLGDEKKKKSKKKDSWYEIEPSRVTQGILSSRRSVTWTCSSQLSMRKFHRFYLENAN